MRAMDMEGRITYVNPAFCAMTGFSEAELIGRSRPSRTGRPTATKRTARLLQQELQGRSPAGGIEVKVMRKDGSLFDARMYVSPLIDPKGQQTGWMTSMTNITEAKRDPRPALGLARALHDRARRAGRRGVGALGAAGRAAVRQPLVPASGSAPTRAATRCWPAATRRCRCLPTRDDSVDSLGGLPTQELTEAGSDPREVYIDVAEEVVRRARALPAMDRRPPGADADRHRHHRAPQRRGAGRAARPRRRRSRAGW